MFRPGEWHEAVFHLAAGADASSPFELIFMATNDSRRPGVPAASRMFGDYTYTYFSAEDHTVSRAPAEGQPVPLDLLASPGFEVAPGNPPRDYIFYRPHGGRRVECSPGDSFSLADRG